MKLLDEMREMPPGSFARRLGYAALLGIGLTMTAFGSIFLANTGAIPFRIFPDVRPVITMGTGLLTGLYGAFGGAGNRKLALWTAVTFTLAFHLEEATVHWIGPFPGSITGTRVGWLGTAGTLVSLASVLIMHVEVEHARLASDLRRRGADADDAWGAASVLARVGAVRVVGVAAGVAGLAVLVRAAELPLGDSATGGVYILFVGAALLLVLALVLVRFVPRRDARKT